VKGNKAKHKRTKEKKRTFMLYFPFIFAKNGKNEDLGRTEK